MRIYGQFKTKEDDTIMVDIFKGNKTVDVIEIGGASGDTEFGSDPVVITSNLEDTFETIIKHTCTITLATRLYLGDYLFANNARDITVLVYKNGEVIFSGWVEPCAYSQPFALDWEEVQITCRDTLGTLEFSRPTDGTTFDLCKANASVKSFSDFIDDMNLIDTNNIQIFYDGSVTLSGSQNDIIFDLLAVSENLWLGEEEDSVMTYEQILTEILKYLNLHIVEIGQEYFIFNWDIAAQGHVNWVDINSGLHRLVSWPQRMIYAEDYTNNDTNFTIDEVFNQIGVKCDLQSVETVIKNPLEESDLTSPFKGRQKFMTEFIGVNDWNFTTYESWWHLVVGDGLENPNKSYIRDWYFQVMQNKNWKFGAGGNDLIEELWGDDIAANRTLHDQQSILVEMREPQDYKFSASLFSFGHTDPIKISDDTPQSTLEMKNCLLIGVNGQTVDGESAATAIGTALYASQPIATYNGNISANYSPVDDDTTNYLVFSGKMQLVPVYGNVGIYTSRPDLNKYADTRALMGLQPSPLDNANILFATESFPINGNDGYYLQAFYWQYDVNGDADGTIDNYLMYPPSDIYTEKLYQFNYSTDGTNRLRDNIKKVPVLECELKIGDKYCVETFNADGDSVFGWYTLDNCPVEEDDSGNTYTKTTFSLGINPAIDDYIIGKTYDISTNFTFNQNINADSGTAIPIKKTDHLNGAMSFKILGLINTSWDDITRRHPTWFRSERYTQNTKTILAHCSSVCIEDFECKVVSDSANLNYKGGNDLKYLSVESDNYINKKDDITFKLNTQLSSAECAELGIDNLLYISSVVRSDNGDYLSVLTNNYSHETAKPEELFVDANYNDHCQPKMLINSTMRDTAVDNFFGRYLFSYLPNREFQPLKIDQHLQQNEINVTFREL